MVLLPTVMAVGNVTNMKATLMVRQRVVLSDSLFSEVVVWQLPEPLPGSAHCFKYRLALVSDGQCVLRYDNEAGKGNHKHIGDVEVPYTYQGLEALLSDFALDIRSWRQLCEQSLSASPHSTKP